MSRRSVLSSPLPWCALVACLAAGAAQAQHGPTDPTPKTGTSRGAPFTGDVSFDELDVNQDGYLSKNELMGQPGLAQNFAKIDKNGDGQISKEEWQARGKSGRPGH